MTMNSCCVFFGQLSICLSSWSFPKRLSRSRCVKNLALSSPSLHGKLDRQGGHRSRHIRCKRYLRLAHLGMVWHRQTKLNSWKWGNCEENIPYPAGKAHFYPFRIAILIRLYMFIDWNLSHVVGGVWNGILHFNLCEGNHSALRDVRLNGWEMSSHQFSSAYLQLVALFCGTTAPLVWYSVPGMFCTTVWAKQGLVNVLIVHHLTMGIWSPTDPSEKVMFNIFQNPPNRTYIRRLLTISNHFQPFTNHLPIIFQGPSEQKAPSHKSPRGRKRDRCLAEIPSAISCVGGKMMTIVCIYIYR